MHSIGKADEARRILARFHSSNNDIRSPLVDLEMKEIEEKIQIDGADSQSACLTLVLVLSDMHSFSNSVETWWDFRPLFTTRADRYRAYMVILIGMFSLVNDDE